MPSPVAVLCALLAAASPVPGAPDSSARALAAEYARAIETLNEKHATKPGKIAEPELAAQLPKDALRALEALLAAKSEAPGLADALAEAAAASLDLARVEDFDRLRARLAALNAPRAAALGVARASPRVLYLGLGGLDEAYLAGFATVFEAVLDGYREVFGFEAWSKVPGKKLRVRVHLEAAIERPPHFAPQFPYHSEIDFPVIDREKLRSPTEQGQFLFYGLCHELGHVIAMWGTKELEEDRHAWAHYTGIVLVEHLTQSRRGEPWIGDLRDARWRSLEKLREETGGAAPALASREGVLALLLGLHDTAGPAAIGAAVNRMDRAGAAQRVNRVRYYRVASFRDALLAEVKDAKTKKAVAALFARAGV